MPDAGERQRARTCGRFLAMRNLHSEQNGAKDANFVTECANIGILFHYQEISVHTVENFPFFSCAFRQTFKKL